MRIALVAPSPVPFVIGGAEKLWWGLQNAIHRLTPHLCELIKLPSPERNFWEILASYRRFAELDLSHFDRVITTKYPAWMVSHPEHILYLQHTLRGLYDTYPPTLPRQLPEAKAPAPVRRLLRLLRAPQLDRTALPELFGALEDLRRHDLPPELFALPGPLLREIVHALDRIALAPREIRAYHAISRTVARRPDYFPPDVPITVLPHPSDLPRYERGPGEVIFTVSRLVRAKRLDLLIQAYLEADVPTPLEIAGTGPEEDRLRRLAGNDPRIRFLGRLTDDEIIAHYARALFVPFIPEDEDMGLITLEAMRSGKPVLTVTDAGGPTEFVDPGRTGLIVEPTVAALVRAIRELVAHPDRTAAMGEAARERVQAIDWPAVVAPLTAPLPPRPRRPRRPRWLLLNTFPAWPPTSGGRQRLYHLYRHLAAHADIHHLCLVPQPGPARTRLLAPGYRETLLPAPAPLVEHAQALERTLGLSAWDLAVLQNAAQHPELRQALAERLDGIDLVVCAHPYLYPLLDGLWQGPLLYDAHNVERDLKAALLPPTPEAHTLLATLEACEGALARRARLTLACSAEDAERLAALYRLEPSALAVVPNGVAPDPHLPLPPAERQALRQRLGLAEHRLGLFIGSHHPPNVEAVRHLHALAPACPGWTFVVVGSVARAPSLAAPPPNVLHTGPVPEREKRLWLAVADLALNPMTSGGGTNLKLPEYAAAGLPILTTPFGRRGQPLEPGQHCLEAPLEAFPQALAQLPPPDELAALARRARERVLEALDWREIARRAWEAIQTKHHP